MRESRGNNSASFLFVKTFFVVLRNELRKGIQRRRHLIESNL